MSRSPIRTSSGWMLAFCLAWTPFLPAQVWIEMVPSDTPKHIPALIDSNSPSFWRDGLLRVFSSDGDPVLNILDANFTPITSYPVRLSSDRHRPMWIESVWQDGNGRLYAWYHHEVIGLCPNSDYTAPEIGALVSYDGGSSFTDLGIVLRSGDPVNCSAQNGYFASGHGDFSVIVDQQKEWVYFLFGSYGGDVSGQGVAIARMSVAALNYPVGAAWKYFEGSWSEPGLGGRVTPIFPAYVSWADQNTDAFWGPSVHWNTYLQTYVVLLNRSCCDSDWPQEGVYLTMNPDLSNPIGWTPPLRIVEGGDWYPWFQGAGPGETSSEAGQRSHLFLRQNSEWDIIFRTVDDIPQPEDPTDDEQGSESAVPSSWILIPGTDDISVPGSLFAGHSGFSHQSRKGGNSRQRSGKMKLAPRQ